MIGGLGFAGAASAAVIAGSATAAYDGSLMTPSDATGLQFSEGGVGHQLLVPYYTVQDGNMTVIHLVNTDTSNGKAVKVRFRGASNSDDVLDFQVFLSPQDVWTAAVTAGSDGRAQIVTADNTCTVPRLNPGVAQPFETTRLNPNSDKAEQTREGYVEIFNIADIPNTKSNVFAVAANPAAGATATANSQLYTLTKHKNGVAPCSAGGADWTALEQIAITDFTGKEADAAKVGFNTPTGGLYGDWYIINVPKTTTFSGGATALRATTGATGAARGNFVHFPQDDGPVTAVENFSADPLFRTGSLDANGNTFTGPALEAGNYDLPDFSTPYLTSASYDSSVLLDAANPLEQAAKLTAALAVKSVSNQYATDDSISAKTDWVFSLPTRRYSVAANYAILADATNTKGYAHEAYRLFSDLTPFITSPVTNTWFYPTTRTTASNTTVDANGNICVTVKGQTFYDREESTQVVTNGSVFSPAKPGAGAKFSLCGEVSVLAFKDAGVSVLGASANIARQTAASSVIYTNGWGVLDTSNGTAGLPILGASFIKLTNPTAAAGFSGTYGITWPHRYTK
jgi:hypothetical protein